MPCFHPKYALVENIFDEDGNEKRKLRFLKFFTYEDYLKEKELRKNIISVPCGKCLGCRLDYSKHWANRCELEAKQYKYNYFVTLTYDDDHIPMSKNNPTLVKSDLSSFIKRLRTRLNRYYSEVLGNAYEYIKVRFFACGEYASRPHYHVILFNCPLPDLVEDFPYFDKDTGELKKTKMSSGKGNKLLYSALLDNCWNKGMISIGECTWESCNYVARYVVKKIGFGSANKAYKDIGITPPFVLMSRKPGIGGDYFEDNLDKIYSTDEIFISKSDGKSLISKPPRYCDKILERENDQLFNEVKEKRIKNCNDGIFLDLVNKSFGDDRTKLKKLEDCEKSIESKTKLLNKRNAIT